MVLNIDYGAAGTAKCVLVPPYNYKKGKYNNNYVSKIANYSEDKNIIDNEIRISKYLKKKASNTIINKYFSIIINNHKLKKSKYKKLKKCNLEDTKQYKILYSKNVGCKPITKHSKILVKNNIIRKIHVNNIKQNKIISNKKIYNSNKIIRTCGDLIQPMVQKKTFSEKKRVNSIKRLIEILKLLYDEKIIHFDIKLDNIVSNSIGDLKLIDFGGGVLLSDFKSINLNNNFNDIVYDLYKNKFFSWTTDYVSPEILIILEFKKNPFIEKEEMVYNIKNIIENSINLSLIESQSLELNELIIYVYTNKKQFIKDMFLNNNNSAIFKSDIYSMGISIYILLKYLLNNKIKLILNINKIEKYKKFNIDKIMILLYNMTRIDYRKRFNILQCLKTSI